jgi:hypothetical protein
MPYQQCYRYRLISHASVRYANLAQLSVHPFFDKVKWDSLLGVQAPFLPALDSEIDTGYYDDFTSRTWPNMLKCGRSRRTWTG